MSIFNAVNSSGKQNAESIHTTTSEQIYYEGNVIATANY